MAKVKIELNDWDLSDSEVHAAYIDLLAALKRARDRDRQENADYSALVDGMERAAPIRQVRAIRVPLGAVIPPFPPSAIVDPGPCDDPSCPNCAPPKGALTDEELMALGLRPPIDDTASDIASRSDWTNIDGDMTNNTPKQR